MKDNNQVKISRDEYDILIKIAYLISDAKMAEKIPEFGNEMNVDPAKNRLHADSLVEKWECMP